VQNTMSMHMCTGISTEAATGRLAQGAERPAMHVYRHAPCATEGGRGSGHVVGLHTPCHGCCAPPCRSQLPFVYKVWNPIPQPRRPTDPAIAKELHVWEEKALGDMPCIHDLFWSDDENAEFAWHGGCNLRCHNQT